MKAWLLLPVLALVGCASPSQVMVNDQGQIIRCSSSGYGLMGAATAVSMTNSCIEDHKKMGYRELDGKAASALAVNQAAIDRLKAIGYVNPVGAANGNVYLVNPDKTTLTPAGETVLTLAAVYPQEKLLVVPDTTQKFFGEYQIERYVMDPDPRIATLSEAVFYRSDDTLAHTDTNAVVMQITPGSPLETQRKFVESLK